MHFSDAKKNNQQLKSILKKTRPRPHQHSDGSVCESLDQLDSSSKSSPSYCLHTFHAWTLTLYEILTICLKRILSKDIDVIIESVECQARRGCHDNITLQINICFKKNETQHIFLLMWSFILHRWYCSMFTHAIKGLKAFSHPKIKIISFPAVLIVLWNVPEHVNGAESDNEDDDGSGFCDAQADFSSFQRGQRSSSSARYSASCSESSPKLR